VTDGTTGAQLSFNQVVCGGIGNGVSGNCLNAAASLCATGYLVSQSNQQCEPCPPNFTYDPTHKVCAISPTNGVCPAGTTPQTNGGKVPVSCTEPVLDNTPQAGNEVQMVVEATSPHVVTVTVTGYVGTSAAGYCPAGTTLTPGVIATSGSPAPGCAFSLTVQENYIEVNNISLIRESSCGGNFNPSLAAIAGDQACFILIKVTGMVILKEGVDCSTEPNGTTAPNPPFYGDPVTNILPTYDCTDGTLRIINIPTPGVQIQLTVSNGTFPTDCLPQALTPKPVGTPGPSVTPTPTDTPTPTPTPDTAVTPTPTPTPPPIVGFEDRAFCVANNSSSTETVVTDQYGLVGYNGDTVTVSATTTTPAPTLVGIAAAFGLDGGPLADIPAWATLHYPFVDSTIPCGTTDSDGNTSCTANVAGSSPGDLLPIDVSGIYNCEEYGIKTYVYVGQTGVIAGPVSLPAQQGICVLRSYAGAVTLAANVVSNLNTQPAVSAGPITLGTYGFPTATPVATNTSTPAPTSTAIPTPTNTPIPTATPTSTPTPTPTDTPTPTATSVVHTLRFTLDAARVDRSGSKGTKSGLDVLQGGEKVWLMMYYTVKDLTGPTKRTTTYALWSGSQLLFKQSFTGSETSPGSSVRYLPLQLPGSLTPGIYEFRATLQLGKVVMDRFWRFVVVAVPGIAA